MTIKDLIDLAPAYALKTLDERQDADFTAALDRAPRHIQALVWDVITRTLAGIEGTLPAVQPAPALRPRTLGLVAAAIAGEKIGEPQTAGGSPIVGRIQPPRRTVNPLWRAAAIGCAAAAVLMGVVWVQMRQEYAALDNVFTSNMLSEKFQRDFGDAFESRLFSASTKFVQFAAGDAAAPGKAVLIIGEGGSAQLLCRDLPKNAAGYQLAVVDSQGRVERVLSTFRGGEQRAVVSVDGLPDLAGARLAILPVGEAKALLTSTNA